MADAVGAVPFVGLTVPVPTALAAPVLVELAQQPPPALLLAATLAATVVGRGGNGALLLSTDYGTLALRTLLALPTGSSVQLKLQPGPPATALLIAIDEPAAQTPANAPQTAAALPPGPSAATAAPTASATLATAAAAAETAEEEPPPAQLDLGSEAEATLVAPPPEQNLPALIAGTRLVLRMALPVPDEPPPPPAGPTPVSVIGTVLPPADDGNGRTALQTPLGTVLLDQHLALPPGTTLALTLLSTTSPAESSSELEMGTVVAARVLGPPAGDPAAALPAGTQVTLRLAVLPPASAAAPPMATASLAEAASEAAAPSDGAPLAPPPLPSPALVGTVVAGTASETLVETPLGMLALESRLALPPGTLLALQRLSATPPEAPAEAPVAQGTTWPALAQALSALDRTLPDMAAQLRAELSPVSGEDLAGTLLFLMSALNSGAWPGAKLGAALEDAGQRDLRLRLENDIAELRQLAEPGSGDWRIFILPLLEGGMIRPVRVYLRRRAPTPASPEQGTRFLLEVDTSRLGAIQLDGLVRPQRFDLVLRSHRAFTAELRQEIGEIFRNSTSASGLSGDITFTTASRFAVAPLEALRAHIGVTA